MLKTLSKTCVIGLVAFVLATLLAVSPLATATSYAAPAASWMGATTDWANVRTGPGRGYGVDHVAAPGTVMTVYETVTGEIVWGGNANWHRVGDALYVYGGLIKRTGSSDNSYSQPATGEKTGTITGWANVRAGPGTAHAIHTTYAPGTSVTIYESVSGETVWGGIPTWHRIAANEPLYIYGGLLAVSSGQSQTPDPGAGPQGKSIVISLSQQWLRAYENGNEVYNAPVTTGQAELPTPVGSFEVMEKLTGAWFYSPWPAGSAYYYEPVQTNFALKFRGDGYYLHDAPWRANYGPGTNGWHQDAFMGWAPGTHGCVNLPYDAAAWIFNWASIGTTLQVTA